MRWYIAGLYILLRLIGQLPLSWLHRLGALIGWLIWRINGSLRHNANITLSIVLTEISTQNRQNILKKSLLEAGKALVEVAKVWGNDTHSVLALVRELRGEALFEQALASQRGIIIAAPHLGCWELLNYWLCSRTPIAIAYRPPRQPALEALLIKARGALAAEQVRAEGIASMRKLYKRLIAGGVVGILPDQQPKRGEGVFAKFFDTPALTMVLLSRLAQRTGATVLFAFAERLPCGTGFRIHFLPAPDGIADPDLLTAVTALNRGIEACVRCAPEQYQWHYKRYSIRPTGDERRLY